MKSLSVITLLIFLMFPFSACAFGPASGFFLPDSVQEMRIKYRAVKGLVVLPVTINDSIQVNLILDTGCRNLILFGKKFSKMFRLTNGSPVQFSGLGSGQPVTGSLSIGNKVSIHQALGEEIPVVIVGSNNVFGRYQNVHGVIGYDIFLKFEIELDASRRNITFRPASKSGGPPAGYSRISLRIQDSRPIMESLLVMENDSTRKFDLLIDTGSSLGLLLKTTHIARYDGRRSEKVLGIGLNGPVSGYETASRKLILRGFEIEEVATGIVSSPWHNNASLGMGVLKDYVLILNYCKATAWFKRSDA